MAEFIGALDHGTSSTRFMVFDHAGNIRGQAQREHKQYFPRPGWVEHDAEEIWANCEKVMAEGLADAGLAGADLAGVGVANQRETVLLWNRRTGRPLANAVVWQCARTRDICKRLEADGGPDRFRAVTGLPIATYFSGPKIRWLLDHIDGAQARAEAGEVVCGTMDSWLIWNLTGGPGGPDSPPGAHVTDVTNASRTLLMDLKTLAWSPDILDVLDIPETMLPRIVSSSDQPWGRTPAGSPLGEGVPVCGALGDQQAALVGQACFRPGQAKNTYGTGCFLLMHTGADPVPSEHGLITTLAYRFGEAPPAYCLEGSVAMAGALVQWLRDNLGIIADASEVESLARTVDDNGGVYIVPAFSGLFAPHWRADARGVIAGLTRYANKAHLARAALEACAYQTRDIVGAMAKDASMELDSLKVDGGMVKNGLLMQFQADMLGVPVIRPRVSETTALGAAYAAGLGAGFWKSLDELSDNWREDKTFTPSMDPARAAALARGWDKALDRSLGWAE